jgi:hypothetical protein
MNLTTLGIDLAKTSFSLVGMDERGMGYCRLLRNIQRV